MKRMLIMSLMMLLLCSSALGEAVLTILPDTTEHEMSPVLYGLFFEDINHAADGGLYAELLSNRSFEYENLLNPQRYDHYTGWQFDFAGGKGKNKLADEQPLNDVNTHYVHINATAPGFSIANTGYDSTAIRGGIVLQPGKRYDFSVYLRSCGFNGTVAVKLTKRDGTLLSDVLTLTPENSWTKHTGVLTALNDLPDQYAYLVLTFDGLGECDVDMASLMPEDRFGRDWPGGGLRADLVETLRDLHPRFLRFPGGCVAEGSYVRSNFYNWKDTVGPLESRRENYNTWGYMQSYGLGFYEYFCLCEEIGALPLPVVHAGLLCQARETREAPIPMAEMDAYIQDVLDLIEFARGGADTEWGALRISMGHPAPFDLRYLAIGNENWGDVYFNRFDVINAAVHEQYPDITTIAAAGPVADNAPSLSAIRTRFPGSMADEHYYMDSDWFPAHVTRYDHYPRTTQIFLGEYAAHEPTMNNGQRPNNLYSALCEAAYLTGIERNSDVVAMCCYAPLLARTGMEQWTPDLIWFDAESVMLTPNYYVQQMFSATLGSELVSSTLEGSSLYHVVTRTETALYVKLVNLTGDSCALTIHADGMPDCEGTYMQLHGDKNARNTLADPQKIMPEDGACMLSNGTMDLTLPAYSVTICTLPLR